MLSLFKPITAPGSAAKTLFLPPDYSSRVLTLSQLKNQQHEFNLVPLGHGHLCEPLNIPHAFILRVF